MSRGTIFPADMEFNFISLTAKNAKDLSGRIFGELKVLGPTSKRGNHVIWGCICSCGNKLVVYGSNLVGGNTTSCGCAHSKMVILTKTLHGRARKDAKNTEYTIHQSMLARCKRAQKNNIHFKRAIKVCQRWVIGENGLSGFECFLADMGDRPSSKHSLDRIDNDGNYEPTNCRWATRLQQAQNTTRNVYVVFGGERLVMSEAIRASGLRHSTVYQRISRGYSREDALSVPLQRRAGHG